MMRFDEDGRSISTMLTILMNGQDFSIFKKKKKVLSWKGPEFQNDTDLGPNHSSLRSHLR